MFDPQGGAGAPPTDEEEKPPTPWAPPEQPQGEPQPSEGTGSGDKPAEE